VALDTAHYRPRQRVGLRARLDLAPGAHVYGRPLPAGYIPMTLEVTAPPGVVVEPVAYPPATPLTVAWTDETLPVYTGRVELATHLIFEELRQDAVVRATLHAQACTDDKCFAPDTLAVELPIRFQPPD
jgi:DsbC/DsbD-like thiol-disulfide interchange protein